MEGKKEWMLVGIVVAAVLVVSGGLVYFGMRFFNQKTDDTSLKIITESSSSISAAPTGSADCPSSSGTTQTVQNSQSKSPPEPYNHKTWLVKSADGINLKVDKLLMEHASVPEIVVLPNGRLAVYVVDFRNSTGADQEVISILTSSDQGKTWTEPAPICLFGKTSSGPAVDPSVVTLPDGRVRLYYFGFALTADLETLQKNQIGNRFYSAISDDGVKFYEEEGVRFQDQQVTDPEVIVRPDGTYLMYISHGQNTLIAESKDGLSYTKTSSSLDKGGVPGAVVLSDGTIRWYGCGQGGIVTATSSDGLSFSQPQLAPLTPKPTDPIICDPSLIRLSDGSFIGVIKTAPAQAQMQPQPK